jgi:hypothetical protein
VLAAVSVKRLPDLNGRDEYRFRTASIRITPPPAWIPGDFIGQAMKRGGLPDEVSLLDAELTAQVAAAFAAHPWVAEVVSVRKSSAGLDVELRYRKPAALVQVKAGLYPIDANGVLLPPEDFAAGDVSQYPVIQNVQSVPTGPAGGDWGDEAISGAARLAEALAPHWKQFGLQSIRVPTLTTATVSADALVYDLLTTGGTRIVWGRAPGSGHPGELSTEQKIGRLQQYLADFQSFEHPRGPYEIDIRHWQEITRRPLEGREPSRR